ncbi:BTAD domain-containing putative transcriptional regulator [Micromonospora soli]|uniref:AfsR/SARP family transcriptional regulator n=1 Tax=Micromonospora sp. NBRC 110009 TaxID=3061627 RepID=UPI002673180B|nr:BTAD domain-containing putative transcriptional regulator [Micromonospora sp. NBRC 110009]WKT96862.1 BTAD domain-containing putative transcriptional regulator [Micromonospora sp. NBRC 110009]
MLCPVISPAATGLCLFAEPHLDAAGQVRILPEGGKRLVAFTALSGGRVDRRQAAGVLWPVGDDVRAVGNLRSALWRLHAAGLDILDADKRQVWIRAGIELDTEALSEWAARLVAGGPAHPAADDEWWRHARSGLLPGWRDEWVTPHRERLRQRVLHAMEAAAARLIRGRDYARAAAVARQVVAAEPLRESAHRVLAEALQSAGRTAEARAAYSAFRSAASTRFGPRAGATIRAALAL